MTGYLLGECWIGAVAEYYCFKVVPPPYSKAELLPVLLWPSFFRGGGVWADGEVGGVDRDVVLF